MKKYLVQAINAMKPDGVLTENRGTLFRNIPSENRFSGVQSYVDMESMSFFHTALNIPSSLRREGVAV